MPPLTMTGTYFRRNTANDDDDDDDRLLFPAMIHSNGGPLSYGGKFQKAAVVYEFSCAGIDCPPSASGLTTSTADRCDLLVKSAAADDQTENTTLSDGTPTGADAGLQLIDLCRRSAALAQPVSGEVSCHHHHSVCPVTGRSSPALDERDCCQSTAATECTCPTTVTLVHGGWCYETSGGALPPPYELGSQLQQLQQQQQRPQLSTSANSTAAQLILYETANVGCDNPSVRLPTSCDYRHYMTSQNPTGGNGLGGKEDGNEDRMVGIYGQHNGDNETSRARCTAEKCDVLVFD
jgi:hypothetical protein